MPSKNIDYMGAPFYFRCFKKYVVFPFLLGGLFLQSLSASTTNSDTDDVKENPDIDNKEMQKQKALQLQAQAQMKILAENEQKKELKTSIDKYTGKITDIGMYLIEIEDIAFMKKTLRRLGYGERLKPEVLNAFLQKNQNIKDIKDILKYFTFNSDTLVAAIQLHDDDLIQKMAALHKDRESWYSTNYLKTKVIREALAHYENFGDHKMDMIKALLTVTQLNENFFNKLELAKGFKKKKIVRRIETYHGLGQSTYSTETEYVDAKDEKLIPAEVEDSLLAAFKTEKNIEVRPSIREAFHSYLNSKYEYKGRIKINEIKLTLEVVKWYLKACVPNANTLAYLLHIKEEEDNEGRVGPIKTLILDAYTAFLKKKNDENDILKAQKILLNAFKADKNLTPTLVRLAIIVLPDKVALEKFKTKSKNEKESQDLKSLYEIAISLIFIEKAEAKKAWEKIEAENRDSQKKDIIAQDLEVLEKSMPKQRIDPVVIEYLLQRFPEEIPQDKGEKVVALTEKFIKKATGLEIAKLIIRKNHIKNKLYATLVEACKDKKEDKEAQREYLHQFLIKNSYGMNPKVVEDVIKSIPPTEKTTKLQPERKKDYYGRPRYLYDPIKTTIQKAYDKNPKAKPKSGDDKPKGRGKKGKKRPLGGSEASPFQSKDRRDPPKASQNRGNLSPKNSDEEVSDSDGAPKKPLQGSNTEGYWANHKKKTLTGIFVVIIGSTIVIVKYLSSQPQKPLQSPKNSKKRKKKDKPKNKGNMKKRASSVSLKTKNRRLTLHEIEN